MYQPIKDQPFQYFFYKINIFSFNFNLFCIHLIHRGYAPLDMETVNTEIQLQVYIHTNIHDVRDNAGVKSFGTIIV
jgi:hypothetical protein